LMKSFAITTRACLFSCACAPIPQQSLDKASCCSTHCMLISKMSDIQIFLPPIECDVLIRHQGTV
jgi:hypothetical protein